MILKLKNGNFTTIKILFCERFWHDNILISNKISSSEKNYKYFIGFIDNYKIKPFRIILRRTSAYVKGYDSENERMDFLIDDDDLLKKCNDI